MADLTYGLLDRRMIIIMGNKTKAQLARQYTRIKGIDGSVADSIVLSLVASKTRDSLQSLVDNCASATVNAVDNGSRKPLFTIAPASCGSRYRTISNHNMHDVRRIDEIGEQYAELGRVDRHLGYAFAKLVRRQLRLAGWANDGKYNADLKLQRFQRDGIIASMQYGSRVHLIVN